LKIFESSTHLRNQQIQSFTNEQSEIIDIVKNILCSRKPNDRVLATVELVAGAKGGVSIEVRGKGK